MKRHLPAAAVIGAGVLWGMISLFIRGLSAAGFDPMQISLIRMGVAAPVFLLAALALKKDLRVRLRDLWMFAGTGIVSIVLFNVSYFYTMIKSEASVAVVLLYTSPVFIMLLSAVIFRERITGVKLIALGLTFAGCFLTAGVSKGAGLTPFVLLTGLASGLFYGLYTIFGRFALNKYPPMTVTALTFIAGAVGSLPIGKPLRTAELAFSSAGTALLCLGIGVVCTVLPYFLYTWGLAKMESGKAAILVAVEPLVGAVLGMALYGESRDAAKLIGIVMILAAIILLSRSSSPETSSKGE
ncbi:MAG: EamA family transporter [Ruminococcus sp.]|nr:EamA family transporter [Ruminococcus sp.]